MKSRDPRASPTAADSVSGNVTKVSVEARSATLRRFKPLHVLRAKRGDRRTSIPPHGGSRFRRMPHRRVGLLVPRGPNLNVLPCFFSAPKMAFSAPHFPPFAAPRRHLLPPTGSLARLERGLKFSDLKGRPFAVRMDYNRRPIVLTGRTPA
jgi:hypothetical protein